MSVMRLSLIPALQRQWQEEVEASLVYILNSRPAKLCGETLSQYNY